MKNIKNLSETIKRSFLIGLLAILAGCGNDPATNTPQPVKTPSPEDSLEEAVDLPAPVSFNIVLAKFDEVDLTWKAAPGSTPVAFKVEISSNGGTKWTLLASTKANELSYIHKNASASDYYRVKAVYGAGSSEPTKAMRPVNLLTQNLPKSLVITGSASLIINKCGKYVVEARDDKGALLDLKNALLLKLDGSGGALFFSDQDCKQSVTSFPIAEGAHSANFYIMSQMVASLSVTANAVAYAISSVPLKIDAITEGIAAIDSLSTNFGPASGGTSVTIKGSFFDKDSTVYVDGKLVASNFLGSDSISFNTPPSTEGEKKVEVKNAKGFASNSVTFTYLGAPVISSLNPTQSSSVGGASIIVTGNKFVVGARVFVDGVPVVASFRSATEISFLTPAHAPGTIQLFVKNPDEQSSQPSNFTYLPVELGPVLSSLSAYSGSINGSVGITLNGQNFTNSSVVRLDNSDLSTQYRSANELYVVMPSHSAGTVSLRVVNASLSSSPLNFTYVGNQNPSLINLSQSSGPTAGSFALSIVGANFSTASKVRIDNVELATNYQSSTTLSVVMPAHAQGNVAITVANSNESISNPLYFNYYPPEMPAPVLSSLDIYSGNISGGYYIRLNGSNFASLAKVLINNVDQGGYSYASANLIYLLAPSHTAGAVSLTVVNPDGKSSAALTFTYTAPQGPTRLSVKGADSILTMACGEYSVEAINDSGVLTPAVAAIAATVGVVGPGALYSSSSCSQTISTATINVGQSSVKIYYKSTSPGSVGISADAAGMPRGYKGVGIIASGPVLNSVAPYSGAATGGYEVLLNGSNFTTTSKVYMGAELISSIYVSANQLKFVAPVKSAGPVYLSILNSDGQSSLTQQFLYTAVAPTLSKITNSDGGTVTSGNTAGGQVLKVGGSQFVSNSVVKVDGISVATTFNSSTSLTFTSPAHSAGNANITVMNPDSLLSNALTFNYVSPNVPTRLSISGPASTFTGTCSDFVLEAKNDGGILTNTLSDLSVTVYDSSGAFGIYLDASCASSSNTIIINRGTSSKHFYAKASFMVGITGLIARASGFPDGTYGVKIYVPTPVISEISPASGPNTGNTVVTVTGSNLGAGAKVLIDGTTVTSSPSGTKITFITPAHVTGRVTLQVTMPNSLPSNSIGFDYLNPTPAPIATAYGSVVGTTLGNKVNYMNGSNYVLGSIVRLDGKDLPTSFVSSTQLGFTYPPHAAGKVNGVVVNPDGKISNALVFEYVAPTFDLSKATVDFGTIAKNTPINGSVRLTNNSGEPVKFVIPPPPSAPFSYNGNAKTFPGIGGNCTDTIAPYNSCTIFFSFNPTAAGTFTSTLSFSIEGNTVPKVLNFIGVGR